MDNHEKAVFEELQETIIFIRDNAVYRQEWIDSLAKLEKRVDKKLALMEERINRRFEKLEEAIMQSENRIMNAINSLVRVQQSQALELTALHARVDRIEKHVGVA